MRLESKSSFHTLLLGPTKPYELRHGERVVPCRVMEVALPEGGEIECQAGKANVCMTQNVMIHLFVHSNIKKVENKARHGGRYL